MQERLPVPAEIRPARENCNRTFQNQTRPAIRATPTHENFTISNPRKFPKMDTSKTFSCPRPSFDREQLQSMRCRLPQYLAARGVELRKQGNRLVAKCPVHEDKSPSFALWGRNHEHAGCFPCSFTGDIFAVAEWLGRASDFPSAVLDVASVLGVTLPQGHPQGSQRPPQAQPQAAKQPEPPFELSESDREKIHAARLAFCDAFHGGEPIVDQIAESLGLTRETLRRASWGACGLGLSAGSYGKPTWLCYCFPQGLKWRNPDQTAKPRFEWLAGRALLPWRWEWASKPEVGAVYLTEGESDTLAMIESGIESDGTAAAVAAPGTGFPREWAPLFAGKRVCICFDTDPPGQAAAAVVAELLRPHAAAVSIWKGTNRQ